MITITHDADLVDVTVLGEFTLADYKEFEEVFNYKIRFEGPVSLLFDLRLRYVEALKASPSGG